jgi:uncharacterized MAPEG superfamily protein
LVKEKPRVYPQTAAMTIAERCVLAAFILTVLSIMAAQFDGRRRIDNASPRAPAFYTPAGG